MIVGKLFDDTNTTCSTPFSLGVERLLPMVFKLSLAAGVFFFSTSRRRDLPYLPRTYISRELYGMPKTRLAWEVVMRLFHTISRALVRSSLVQERGGPPRGALCCPLARGPEIYKFEIKLATKISI